MANKPKDQKPTELSVKEKGDLIEFGKNLIREENEKLKQELVTKTKQHEAIGALKKIQYERNHNDLLEAIILYRIKESKAYKEHGFTWEQFCEVAGFGYKTADRILDDLAPILEKFSDNFGNFAGVELRKIRYLGRAISDKLGENADLCFEFKDGAFRYGDEIILPTQEDLSAFVDSLQDTHQKKESSLKKQIENKDAQLRAKDRVLEDTHKTLEKLHLRIDSISRLAEDKGLTPEQAAFLSRMETLRLMFDGSYMVHLDTDAVKPDLLDEDGKPVVARMRAAYLATLHYFKLQIDYAYGQAEELYGDPDMLEDTAWKQPTLEEMINLKKGRSPSTPFPSGKELKSIKS